MKILYLDFLYPKGHLNLDKNHINILSKIGEVSVISPSGRYSNLPEGVNLIEKDSIFIYEGRLSNRLSSLKAMLVS